MLTWRKRIYIHTAIYLLTAGWKEGDKDEGDAPVMGGKLDSVLKLLL